MKKLFLVIYLVFFIDKPILSHGQSGSCNNECNQYYCPSGNERIIQEKSSKNWNYWLIF